MCDPFQNPFFGPNFPPNFPPIEGARGYAPGCICKPKPSKKFIADLTSCREVPKNCSKALGTFVALLSPDNSKLDFVLQTCGLHNIIGAYFHIGKPGCNGPPIKVIPINPGTGSAIGCWTVFDYEPLTPDIVCKLKKCEIYINIATNCYPEGEIRGQIEKITLLPECKNE